MKTEKQEEICKCGHDKSNHTDSQPDMIGYDNLGKCIVVIGKKPIKPVKIWTGKFKRFVKVYCPCKKFQPVQKGLDKKSKRKDKEIIEEANRVSYTFTKENKRLKKEIKELEKINKQMVQNAEEHYKEFPRKSAEKNHSLRKAKTKSEGIPKTDGTLGTSKSKGKYGDKGRPKNHSPEGASKKSFKFSITSGNNSPQKKIGGLLRGVGTPKPKVRSPEGNSKSLSDEEIIDKVFIRFRDEGSIEMLRQVLNLKNQQFKEAIKRLKEEYPCVMKKRKCKYDNNAFAICSGCSVRFKINQIFGDDLI